MAQFGTEVLVSHSKRMRRWLAPLAALGLICATLPAMASAQEEARVDDEARGLFLAGRAAFDDGRWAEALAHFQHAYELSQRPGLLYNIGQTADRMRDDETALDAFERFLEASPDAPNRAAVEARIAVLRQAIAESRPAPETTDEADTSPPEEQAETDDAPPPPAPSRVGPVVTLAAGGAAMVAGGALLLLADGAAGRVTDADAGTPWTSVRGDYDTSGRLGVAGGVLLGLGAAVAATGVVWLVMQRTGGEDVEVALSPRGAVVRGRF